MRIAQMRKYDVANGVGIRSTIFTSGCSGQNCKNCFNKEYQDFNYGEQWNKELEDKYISYLKMEYISGATVLGGEPMQQIMDNDLINLLKRINREVNKPIWIFSGYTFEQIIVNPKRLEILQECEVLVDGKFEEDLKDLRLKFKGSSNQRIINVQKSLKKGEVVLHELDR